MAGTHTAQGVVVSTIHGDLPMQAEQRDHGDWNLPAELPKPAQRALAACGLSFARRD
jgi:hypothetical protein